MNRGYQLANCSKRCFPDMLQSFVFSWDDFNLLSYPDYSESKSYAYVIAEHNFIVRKTKKFSYLL